MGVKVKIMLPQDPTGKAGVKAILPDNVDFSTPKQDDDEPEIRSAPATAPQ